MPIRAAVFDVDGTVATCPYDFDAMRASVAAAAHKWGVDAAELGVRGVIEQIDLVDARLGAEGAAFRREAEDGVTAIEVAAARTAELLPGAAEALADLKRRGVAIALITRNCRGAAQLVLRDLDSYSVLLTRDDVPLAKPDPDHVLRSLAALGCRPDEAAVIGDHDYDMQSGRAAGVRLCIGVRTGGRSDDDLLWAGAHHVIDSLADLPGWLESQGEIAPC